MSNQKSMVSPHPSVHQTKEFTTLNNTQWFSIIS